MSAELMEVSNGYYFDEEGDFNGTPQKTKKWMNRINIRLKDKRYKKIR